VNKKHRNESFESLFRRFKRSVERNDVLLNAKKKNFYEKPSAVKKRSRDVAKNNELRRQEEDKPKRW